MQQNQEQKLKDALAEIDALKAQLAEAEKRTAEEKRIKGDYFRAWNIAEARAEAAEKRVEDNWRQYEATDQLYYLMRDERDGIEKRRLAAEADAQRMRGACEAALEALRGAITSHSRGCAINEGNECDCWLPLRRQAIGQLEEVLAREGGGE